VHLTPLQQGLHDCVTLLWFGAMFGLAAKLLGRSFWRWFLLGALARILLVSLDLMA
jgi:hypothetical protein